MRYVRERGALKWPATLRRHELKGRKAFSLYIESRLTRVNQRILGHRDYSSMPFILPRSLYLYLESNLLKIRYEFCVAIFEVYIQIFYVYN